MQDDERSTNSLSFKSYEGDILAVFLIDRMRLTRWWKLSGASVILYAALMAMAFVVHTVFRSAELGLGSANVRFIFAGFNGIMVVLIASLSYLYVRMYSRIGSLYKELGDTGVIYPVTDEIKELVAGKANSIRKIYQKPIWVAVAIVGMILTAGPNIVYFGIWKSYIGGWIIEFQSTWWWFSTPIFFLALYMMWMIVIRAFITARGLFMFFNTGPVRINPLATDKCGGFKPMSEYIQDIMLVITILGVSLIALFAVDRLPIEGTNDPTAPPGWDFISWGWVVIYLILAPATLFLNLFAAHGPMKRYKKQHLQKWSEKFNEDYEFIYSNVGRRTNVITERVNHLVGINSLYLFVQKWPVWPVNWTSIAQLTRLVFVPIIPIVLKIALAVRGLI